MLNEYKLIGCGVKKVRYSCRSGESLLLIDGCEKLTNPYKNPIRLITVDACESVLLRSICEFKKIPLRTLIHWRLVIIKSLD